MNKFIILEQHSAKMSVSKGQEGVEKGMLRVEGVLGVCEVLNRNNRFYNASNYKKMVEALQARIVAENGVFGELEHPKSMRIDLNNISHKLEAISFDESTGEVRGSVILLDTPKGMIAQSIVRSGSPLPISSRGMGSIDESKCVTLTCLETFDLVGTAGFKQAQLFISESLGIDESFYASNNTFGMYECDDSGIMLESKQPLNSSITMEGIMANVRKYFVEDVSPQIEGFVKNAIKEEKGEDGETKSYDESKILGIVDNRIKTVALPSISEWVTKDLVNSVNEDRKTVIEETLALVDKKFVVTSEVFETWNKEQIDESKKWFLEKIMPNMLEGIKDWVVEEFAPAQTDVIESFVKNSFAPEFGEVLENYMLKSFVKIDENADKKKEDEAIAKEQEKIDNETDESPSKDDDAKKEKAKAKEEEEGKNSGDDGAKSTNESIMESLSAKIARAKTLPKEVVTESKKPVSPITENAPYWVQAMPLAYKGVWNGLNESQQGDIFKKATLRSLHDPISVKMFWESLDLQQYVEGLSKTTSIKPITEGKKQPSGSMLALMESYKTLNG